MRSFFPAPLLSSWQRSGIVLTLLFSAWPTLAQTASKQDGYLDPDLPLAQRVDDLVGRMTLPEKVSQMQNKAPAIPRLHIAEYDWWNEGLHGVARSGYATVFPQAIGLAATWDTALVHRVAELRPVSATQRLFDVLELRAGKTALSAERYEQFSWRMHHTKPGDYLFQISWPNVYFPLDLRSPTFVDWLWINEVTRPEWADLTVRQLEDKQVKYVLCSPWLSWPVDPTHPWQDHLGPFRDYLRSHYTRVHVFLDQDEAWERN